MLTTIVVKLAVVDYGSKVKYRKGTFLCASFIYANYASQAAVT